MCLLNHRCRWKNYIAGLLVVLALLLMACEASRDSRKIDKTTTPLATPDSFTSILPDDISGTGLVGQLVSDSNGAPLGDTVVRLARVFWNEEHTEGVYVLEGARSPSSITDSNGFFVFKDVDPGDYVMIVGDVYGDHVIISNPNGTARIFTIEQGKIMDAEQVKVTLP